MWMETYSNVGRPERRVDELFYIPDDPRQENNALNAHLDEAKRLHGALRDLITYTDIETELAAVY